MLTQKQINSIKNTVFENNDRTPIVLKALGDPGRYRIFKVLIKYHEICVTDIAAIIGITVPAASQQLRVLEMTGLVKKRRMGQIICYEAHYENILVKRLCKLIS